MANIEPLIGGWLIDIPVIDESGLYTQAEKDAFTDAEKEHQRIWSGTENIEFPASSGDVYLGAGTVLSIGPASFTTGHKEQSLTATMIVNPAEDTSFLQDPGLVQVIITWIWSRDVFPFQWNLLGKKFVGFLSNPRFNGEHEYQIDIATYTEDVDRGTPLRWSHAAQQNRYPGDKGYEYLRDLGTGFETRWPHSKSQADPLEASDE